MDKLKMHYAPDALDKASTAAMGVWWSRSSWIG